MTTTFNARFWALSRAMGDGLALELKNVGVRRGGSRIFESASFNIEGGGFATLEGANGSGKSTLLRVIAGLVPLAVGEVTVNGIKLGADRDSLQTQILYSGHLDAVKPSMTVGENLLFWARFYGNKEANLALALAKFDLEAMIDTPAAACSAGQKRRLGLARLAVVRRPIWLLDEPTVSLDRAAVEKFGGLIDDQIKGGGVVLAATHTHLGREPERRINMAAFSPKRDQETGSAIDDPFLVGDWS